MHPRVLLAVQFDGRRRRIRVDGDQAGAPQLVDHVAVDVAHGRQPLLSHLAIRPHMSCIISPRILQQCQQQQAMPRALLGQRPAVGAGLLQRLHQAQALGGVDLLLFVELAGGTAKRPPFAPGDEVGAGGELQRFATA